MRRLLALLPLLLGVMPALADPPIRFPEVQQAPQPPAPVSVLSADRLYVIDSDIELLVLCSPKELVRVIGEPGPLRIRGRFVDGGDQWETRTYSGKFVYTVEPKTKGKCELLVVPVGVKAESEVIRKELTVADGTDPQPPPPGPDPEPQPKPQGAKFWVIAVEESADRTPDTAKVLGDLKYWQELGKTHLWRHYDDDTDKGAGYAKKAKEKGVTLPAVLLYAADAKSGDEPVSVFPLPKTTDEITATIRKNGGK